MVGTAVLRSFQPVITGCHLKYAHAVFCALHSGHRDAVGLDTVEIEYFEMPEVPGSKMFRCAPLMATMSVNACSLRWRGASNKGAPERLDRCRNCRVGARHAGASDASLSPLHGMSICGRCHSGATRLIRGHLCVSCYNREREYVKGRNARGKAPKLHPMLHHLAIRYRAGAVVKLLTMPHVVNTTELVIAALRDEPKQVTFCALVPRPAVIQEDLFA